MTTSITGPSLAAEVCARRLIGAGAKVVAASEAGGSRSSWIIDLDDAGGCNRAPARCTLSWYPGAGQASEELESEVTVQAACGLMFVHGLEGGRPRRIGLEVASAAAGMLGAQAVLAASIARWRGGEVETVEASVAQGAMCLITQYVARATAGAGTEWAAWLPQDPGPEPGPPFPTADPSWIEVETLSTEGWHRFWSTLGVSEAAIRRGWNLFRPRYATATASMPPGFHAATARCRVAELAQLGRTCGVSVVRLSSYEEVVDDVALRELAFPAIEPGTCGRLAPPALALDHPRETAASPLDGILVVEATSRIQGPLAGSLLRMLGARVLRVEPPGGDGARMEAPLAGEAGAFFLATNRGKQPVELDLRSPHGRDALRGLVAGADVFLHNWRTGKAEEWDLSYAKMSPANPGLVYCHASGWGRVAARCPPIAMEFLVQALTGLGHAVHPEGRPPFPTRMLVSDVFGALLACEGILSALLQRERLGAGSFVETSLVGGAMAMQAHIVEALAEGRPLPGRHNGRPVWGPLDDAMATSDGFLVVAGDIAPPEDIAGRSTAEWDDLLTAAGIPHAPVCCDLASLPLNPRLAPLLEPLGGTSWAPGPPWRLRGPARPGNAR